MMDLTRFTRFDWYSIASIPVELFFDETPLATATAFFWKEGEELFLVTAWHNLSGRHYQTRKHVSPTKAEPNRIRIWWNVDAQPVGQKKPMDLPLWDTDGDPLWIVHPKRGSSIDVAALAVQIPDGMEPYPINCLPEGHGYQGMGKDLFILGYPLGIKPFGLPVWKRGSLAFETDVPDEIQPYWLVDTASRPGMSGAPVIERLYPFPSDIKEKIEMSTSMLTDRGNIGLTAFIGIYSGRLQNEGESDIQLGLVWPSWFIEAIARNGKRDDRS